MLPFLKNLFLKIVFRRVASVVLVVGGVTMFAAGCSHSSQETTPTSETTASSETTQVPETTQIPETTQSSPAPVNLETPSLAGEFSPYLTSQQPFITLASGVPAGSSVKAIINSGDTLGDFIFRGIPDGIGIAHGTDGKVNVFVSHEENAPQNATVSKLTLNPDTAAVLGAKTVIPREAGFVRFCSGSMAGPREGFSTYVYFANEELSSKLDVPPNAPYSADPSIAPKRQAGYVVALNANDDTFAVISGLGRINHENTIALAGYRQIVLLTTDDTFSGPTAQLYMYIADNEDDFWADRGKLYAFRATHGNDGAVDATDPQNGANDYLDLRSGYDFKGEFIPVPDDVARGLTDKEPQAALEDWSDENNVFQFIRLEDIAYDKNDPNVIYFADTGRSRVVPDPETGRLTRGESGTDGGADNGRMFTMVLDENDPKKVTSLSVLANGDDPSASNYVAMRAPDNIDTSAKSLIVQEDASDAKIWHYDFSTRAWSVIATVNSNGRESSGVVDASEWFGDGAWLLDVQGSENIEVEHEGEDITLSSGQLMLLKLPGS